MNIPEMTPVESSNVAAVGYDGSNLFVGFDVPEMVYEGLMQAASKGSFLHKHVINQYRYERLK